MHPRAREDPGSTGSPVSTRRQVLRAAGTVGALGAVGGGGYLVYRRAVPPVDPRTEISLYSQTVAYGADEARTVVRSHEGTPELRPDSRLLAELSEDSPVVARAQEFWDGTATWRATVEAQLGSGRDRADGTDGDLLTDLADSALLDLWVLSDDLPAPVAGWSTSWRHIWPRDAAFCAVALARVGHPDRAIAVLEHLQSLQADDGWYEARYSPEHASPPDDRPRQFDGTGLVLWALDEIAGALPDVERAELLDRLSALVTTTSRSLMAATEDGTSLPPASPDYWELREHRVTLGIMTATLAGLRAAAALTGEADVQTAAGSFAALFTDTFGAHGFQRYRRRGGADSALAFLDATGCHGIVPPEQLQGLRQELARPGGGITPGAAWRKDGVSWTPSTSLLALALARAEQPDAALDLLGWLAEHRTTAGSLPEKVLFDGRPAAVAPLAWTAANVLLTLDALTRR